MRHCGVDVKPTESELKKGCINKKTVEAAAAQLQSEGYMLLEGVVSKELLKKIRTALVPLRERYLRLHPRIGREPPSYGKGGGIFGMQPPRQCRLWITRWWPIQLRCRCWRKPWELIFLRPLQH